MNYHRIMIGGLVLNTREQFLSILEGNEQDRMLFTPRLDIWYNSNKKRGTLPQEYLNYSLEEIRIDLGVDMSVRGGKVFKIKMHNVEIKEERLSDKFIKHYVTPVGWVSEEYNIDIDAEKKGISTNIKTGHLIKGENDYKIVEYIINNTYYEPCYEEFIKYEEEIGDRGYPLCVIGLIPMNDILLNYIGYNNAYYEMEDNLEKIEHLNEIMTIKLREMQDIIIDSPARLFLHGNHFDSQMTPPSIFEKYFVPYYKELVPKLNSKGKWVAAHQDGDASNLLNLFKEAGIHVADCFACSPLVKCSFEEAINVWKKDVVIWGGIPSTILSPDEYSEEEFDGHMKMVLENMKKGRVILAVSDNVMPDADINRLRRIVKLIR